ncbi:MAG TPA: diaminopimelate dehydrogenase [Firmicutes bacterium]|nr:diaminopimelate dehydrogenase [Bacillota bacterium]
MQRTRVAVVGLGSVGRGAADAVAASPDFQLVGVVRRRAEPEERASGPHWEVPAVTRMEQLDGVQAALMCGPTRQLESGERALLRSGVSVVDTFDIHGDALWNHRQALRDAAVEGGARAVISAGWDPGTDSAIRALLEVIAPFGITYTNFGPGMSMGHSVAVRALPGVADAVSITLPAGYGRHRRAVYVKLDGSRPFADVECDIRQDPYFVRDETDIVEVECMSQAADSGHKVVIDRKGTAGCTGNQLLRCEMRISNPAVTGQIMVGALRAGLKKAPGAYTLIELPAADMLPGSLEDLVKRIV